MPLPPDLDKKIRERFEEITIELKGIFDEYKVLGGDFMVLASFSRAYNSQFESLKVKTMNLFRIIDIDAEFIDKIKTMNPQSVGTLYGWIVAYKDDYEKGFLDDLTQMIEANITSDYLELAEDLLTGSKKQTGSYNHIPAAVLTGAILEESLRILCQRQNPPIDIKDKDGKPKNLGGLIDSLKKDKKTGIGLFDELIAKQLRAWADIRNAAAHGEFSKIKEPDVELMITGVRNFLVEMQLSSGHTLR